MDLTAGIRGVKSLRRPLTALVLLVGLSLTLTPALAVARVMPRTSPKQTIAGRYIVVLRDSVADPQAAADRMSKRHRFNLRHVYRRALKGFAAQIPESILPRLKQNSDIAFIEPDRLVYALEQTLPSGVDRIQADRNDTAQNNPVDVDIAIIDTGIDLDHP
ncbi:MAG: protease inhibitor I9 family protein, partial [Deltaproteobacteria bacterium]|nr:protease inhibitor I9 family protein [Deltaproteobacteria bacterium]